MGRILFVPPVVHQFGWRVVDLMSGRVWDLYAKMDSLAPMGLAAPVTYIATKDDGQEIDIGDFQAKPAFMLRGRIILSDGAAIPTGKLRLSP